MVSSPLFVSRTHTSKILWSWGVIPWQISKLDRRPCGRQWLTLLLLIIGLSASVSSLTGKFTSLPPVSQRVFRPALIGSRERIYRVTNRSPWLSLQNGREVPGLYLGPPGLSHLLAHVQAEPLTLAAADFDEDGAADLISGYIGPGGGILTLRRGNPLSVHSSLALRASDINQAAPSPGDVMDIRSSFLIAPADRQISSFAGATIPFHLDAQLYPIPESPDFLTTGDFNADGHDDVAVAARGSRHLYWLAGNGSGTLGLAQAIELNGGVTGMAVGEINRADGLADLAVGIDGPDGPALLLFESPRGALCSEPIVIPLSGQVTSLAIGLLDGDHLFDVVVASGGELLILRGGDWSWSRAVGEFTHLPKRLMEKVPHPVRVSSVAIGDFIEDKAYRGEIVVVGEDGTLCFLTLSRLQGVRLEDGSQQWDAPSLPSVGLRPLPCERDDDLRLALGKEGWIQPIRAKISSRRADDIVLLNHDGQPSLLISTGMPPLPSYHGGAWLDVPAVAVLPLRLNGDALDDLVILQRGRVDPIIVLTVAAATFTVTTTENSGPGSLRQAILSANSSPGPDLIVFNIPSTGRRAITPSSPLPAITEAVTIDGTTQPGGRVELTGTNAGTGANGLTISGGNSVVRGLVINKFRFDVNRLAQFDLSRVGGNGIHLNSPNNIVEGNLIGTDSEGATALGNDFAGVLITAANNVIGGINDAARNILSGNFVGVGIASQAATGNRVVGNYIGTDATGTSAVANSGGIVVLGAGNNIIGGAASGARNVIAGNIKVPAIPGLSLTGGVAIINFQSFVGARGNVIQGNLIGLDRTGGRVLGNGWVAAETSSAGLFIGDASDNTIGGTVAGAGNVISGNIGHGIVIGSTDGNGARGNLIQGNRIGTLIGDVLRPAGNTLHGIFVTSSAGSNVVGGTDAGAGNVIAFNGRSGIFVESGTGNAILSNSIHSNTGLGIDLTPEGVTNNDSGDADPGANNRQNFPELTQALSSAEGTTVEGTLASMSNAPFTIQFFANTECDPSGNGEGQTFVGAVRVTTDSSGNARITFSLPSALPRGQFVTATATDAEGNTSEFSRCIAVALAEPDIDVPARLSFGQVVVGQSGTQNLPIKNLGTASLVVTELSVTSSVFKLTSPGVPITIAPGGEQQIRLRFDPPALGPHVAQLIITCNDPDETTVPVELAGEGIAQPMPDIEVSTARLNFERVPIGQMKTQSLTIRNVGTAVLRVNTLTVGGGGSSPFTVLSPSLPVEVVPQGEVTVVIRFAPIREGEVNDMLTILSDDPDESRVEISLVGVGVSSSSTRTLSAPSIEAAAGEIVAVRLTLSDGSSIAALQFVLTYDRTLLSVQEIAPGPTLPAGFSLSVNSSTPGQVSMLVVPPIRTPLPTLPAGVVTIAIASFRVADSAADDMRSVLGITGVSTSDPLGNAVMIVTQDGSVTVVNVRLGDVNLDKQINAQDLIRLSLHLTGERPLTGRELKAADANCDQVVNVQDFVLLIRHLTGELTLPARCGASSLVAKTIAGWEEAMISFGEIRYSGDAHLVPVRLHYSSREIAAIELLVTFNPLTATLEEVIAGDLVPHQFRIFARLIRPGEIKILILPPCESPLPTLAPRPGELLFLRLKKDLLAEPRQIVELKQIALSDGLGYGVVARVVETVGMSQEEWRMPINPRR